MDRDGKVGLKAAPAALLDRARQRTRGYPRALEALFAILSADRYTTLDEILAKAEHELPENVVEALVGEAFVRLDPTGQRVMQALAVYARPVTPAAVDYLLQPSLLGLDSAAGVGPAGQHALRPPRGREVLPSPGGSRVCVRADTGPLPCEGRGADFPLPWQGGGHRSEPGCGTRSALLHRAADYFKQARKPRADWKTLDDLAPQLAEFDLRCAVGEYDTAADVLTDIDFDCLLLWGHFRLMAELHERLQGKLADPTLKGISVGNLGIATLDGANPESHRLLRTGAGARPVR